MTDIKTLYILRHAKADWPENVADFDRPLADKGHRDAHALAAQMNMLNLRPDIIYCSAARRTRETCAFISSQFRIVYEEPLYQASAGHLYERVKDVDPSCNSAMLVGHNPGIHEIVRFLTGAGEDSLRELLSQGYAPGTLAVLTFDQTAWREIMPGTGRLTALLTAKQRA